MFQALLHVVQVLVLGKISQAAILAAAAYRNHETFVRQTGITNSRLIYDKEHHDTKVRWNWLDNHATGCQLTTLHEPNVNQRCSGVTYEDRPMLQGKLMNRTWRSVMGTALSCTGLFPDHFQESVWPVNAASQLTIMSDSTSKGDATMLSKTFY